MRFSEGFVTVCNTEQTILLLWLIKEMNSWILGITLDIPVSSEQKQTNTEVCNPIYSQAQTKQLNMGSLQRPSSGSGYQTTRNHIKTRHKDQKSWILKWTQIPHEL
ncbi:uncharacterized protein [Canis lupus baileyi]|uniref:uncharacterized protein LOC111093154 isoform X2 n=1 Tax=Canis lupus familiaris TaxID=9615 RepID=UPI000BAA0977|nr:uncharacterized protein LOC111093154 isoform X2 [Canis lupus familiaris]XP_038316828.1 uncharacterized protein LOC111093154 isoform X17 [Canis lupus familiaris]XP_038435554.1 uncharacterized protein LOC111093154 isoform X2 [Canis lupus familiaris]|eukprot:XP_022268071.1 uncharacterized protein LOC111093154 isoform X2 [Canis lupus familiaris]